MEGGPIANQRVVPEAAQKVEVRCNGSRKGEVIVRDGVVATPSSAGVGTARVE